MMCRVRKVDHLPYKEGASEVHHSFTNAIHSMTQFMNAISRDTSRDTNAINSMAHRS